MNQTDRQTADSYYESSKNFSIDANELQGDKQFDVVVIGGGLTGCGAALELAEKGVSVALLESRHFGWGASGRSGGQIISGFGVEQDSLEKIVGLDSAKELWEHSLRALDYTRGKIEKHDINCDLTRGYIHVGEKPRHCRELQEWVEHMDKVYDYSIMQYVDQSELSALVTTDAYSGGVIDPGSGHLHPLNYSLGLARGAQKAGANLFQNSAVVRVEQSESKNIVCTENGKITCDSVIYACNAYLDNLNHVINKKIMPVGTYIIATEPLGESLSRSLIADESAIADTNFVLDYYRISADFRMLFGGRVSYSTIEPVRLADSLRKRMLRIFPALAPMKIDYAWGGFVAITQNRAPHIGQLPNNRFFAQGFSGHGMALSGYIGALLARACLGEKDEIAVFESIPHRSFPGGSMLRMPTLVAAMAYHRLRDYL